jgi:AcrR family transcriptional regulator
MDNLQRIRAALSSGELGEADLTARKLSAFLGRTTSVLYHHWGSLDGLLYAVSRDGYRVLGERLTGAASGGLQAVAAAFVEFGLEQPVLYGLMFERGYDWAALRSSSQAAGPSPGLALWARVVEALRCAGSDEPEADARVLFAGLHGLVSLARSGRANIGDLSVTDREAALAAARRLVSRLTAGMTPLHSEK